MSRFQPKKTPKAVEAVARSAAQRATAIVCRYYETGLAVRHKGEIDLVTKADEESQAAIVRTISRAFPGDEILAEEGGLGHDRSLDGPIWVIDPLDGTTNFAHGFPVFSVAIAYREGGQTQFGLVTHPLLKETFLAHRGKGATLNGRRIRVSRAKTVSRALLATGFPYDRRTSPENNLREFCHFEMAALCVRRAGSACLDLAYVACGRLDGFWELKLAPWDVTAGALLVEEAGGKATDYGGRALRDLWCGQTLASNGLLHQEMVSALVSLAGDPR